jgi:protein TonB
MKKSLALLALLLSISIYSQKKYYTEDFTELSTAEGATYYSTYEDNEQGTNRKRIILMDQ